MPFRRLSAVAVLALTLSAAASPAPAQSRASQLHDALNLSAAQEPAWRTFLAATAPSADMQAQAEATARLAPTLPTPRRLALIRSQMQADLAAFDRTAQAIDAFYAQLSPAQQAVFDAQTRAPARGNGPPGR